MCVVLLPHRVVVLLIVFYRIQRELAAIDVLKIAQKVAVRVVEKVVMIPLVHVILVPVILVIAPAVN